MSASIVVRSPRALYRYLLKRVALLPTDAQEYYRHRIKQEFNSHSDESNPERIQQIIERAVRDADWVVQKYQKA